MKAFLFIALTCFPVSVFAAGSVDEPPSNPIVNCTGGQVYDAQSKKCVDPKKSQLDRDVLYEAVRHLAYAERYHDALTVLAAMPENDTGRLTYMGFTYRKLGQTERAMTYYREAIRLDPANVLARSYMGQGLVAEGDFIGAMAQLDLIRMHGGSGSWSERSLRTAIATGQTFNY